MKTNWTNSLPNRSAILGTGDLAQTHAAVYDVLNELRQFFPSALSDLVNDLPNTTTSVLTLTDAQKNGTADATPAFQAAYVAANGSHIRVPAGTYRFDGSIVASGAIPLNIDFTGSTIQQNSNAAVINLNAPALGTSIGLSADAAKGQNIIQCVTTTLNVGDWIAIQDNAVWPGPKAALGGEYKRIHQIDTTGQLRTKGDLDATYTVANTARVRLRQMIKGTRIVGGTWVTLTPGPTRMEPMIRLTGHSNYYIGEVTMRGLSGPGITLSGCVEGVVNRPSFYDLYNDAANGNYGYGVEAFGPTNTLLVNEPFMSGGRHLFTTNSSASTSGVPRHIWVVGGYATGMTETCYDTHEEGEYIHFINPRVVGTFNSGIKHRSPNSTIVNPQVINSDGTAIRVLETALGCVIDGGYVDNIRGLGLNLKANGTFVTGGLLIKNTTLSAVQIDDAVSATNLNSLTALGAIVYQGTSTGHVVGIATTNQGITIPSTVTVTRNDVLPTGGGSGYTGSDAVKLTTDQSIDGVKTFTSVPIVTTAPTASGHLVNKTYADTKQNSSTAVNTTSAQSITGVKTFNSSPIVPTATTTTQAANKGNVDNAILAATITVVQHGATAATARPTGAVSVLWIGTVTPTNMTTNDLYLNNGTLTGKSA